MHVFLQKNWFKEIVFNVRINFKELDNNIIVIFALQNRSLRKKWIKNMISQSFVKNVHKLYFILFKMKKINNYVCSVKGRINNKNEDFIMEKRVF